MPSASTSTLSVISLMTSNFINFLMLSTSDFINFRWHQHQTRCHRHQPSASSTSMPSDFIIEVFNLKMNCLLFYPLFFILHLFSILYSSSSTSTSASTLTSSTSTSTQPSTSTSAIIIKIDAIGIIIDIGLQHRSHRSSHQHQTSAINIGIKLITRVRAITNVTNSLSKFSYSSFTFRLHQLSDLFIG